MSKPERTKKEKLSGYIFTFGEFFSITPKDELFCKLCHVIVNSDKKYNINSHISSKRHQNKLKTKKSSIKQEFLNEKEDPFIETITEAFLSANIPLHKLRHPAIKTLFNKLNHPIPKETTCRKVVDILYEKKKQEYKLKFKNNNFFMIIDESQHLNKKYVNIQIGLLSEPSKVFLVKCNIKKRADSDTILEMIYSLLQEYDLDISFMSLLIFDAASYIMMKTGTKLQKKHDNIFHITCFVHLLHNCALKIKNHFKNIDLLISSVKMTIIKSVDRREKFIAIPLPPQPIITRWGSWLEACEYYYIYLPDVIEVVKGFEKDGKIIDNALDALTNTSLIKDLIYIHRNYKKILELINRTQEKHFSIEDAIEAFNSIQQEDDVVGVFSYMKSRFKNNEFLRISSFEKDGITPKIFNELMRCPSTSISIERSFSLLNKLVTKEKHFNDINVEKYMVLYCNS